MKTIVTISSLTCLVLITSSCGTSPDVEEPVIQPPVLEEPVNYSQTAIPINSATPIARRVQGRPGFVFNPFNQNMVEVEGIMPGTKVRDPQDADPSHVFLVP